MTKATIETDTDAWMMQWSPSEFLKSVQLTPEQRAQLQAQARNEIERARGDGVYEWLAGLRGKVTFRLSDWEVRDQD